MTLYQEKIDEFCLEKLKELEPLYITIYWAIRNFLHGFSLYLILILLAHLSDIENKKKPTVRRKPNEDPLDKETSELKKAIKDLLLNDDEEKSWFMMQE